MGKSAYSIAVQNMGELINKANLSEAAVKEALKPINEQLEDMATHAEVAAAVAPKTDKVYVDLKISDVEGQMSNNYASLDTKINSAASGSPRGTYATLSALQAAFPTGTTGIYVVVGDGKWYYWNGSAWTAGGTYQSTGIATGEVQPNNIFSAVQTANLLDYDTIVHGYVFSVSNGNLVALAGLAVSDFIPVDNIKTYTISNQQQTNLIGMYSANKTYLGVITGNTSDTSPLTFSLSNPNARFIRINMQNSRYPLSSFMMVEGDVLPNNYVPYGFKLPWLRMEYSNVDNTPEGNVWDGKDLYLFGDSITYWDNRPYWNDPNILIKGYPSYIHERLSANIFNMSTAGATMATTISNNINNIMKSTNLSNAYACIITAGTNDNSQGTPIGTIGDRGDTTFDLSTYFGALRDCIYYAYSQNPKIKIYLMTPLQMATNPLTSFGDAMRDVAKMYGIPILSLDQAVQINSVTGSSLTFDGVHPNNDGYKVMADAIVPFLSNY